MDEVIFVMIVNCFEKKMVNWNVKVIVYWLKMVGIFVLIDNYCLGFIYFSEWD